MLAKRNGLLRSLSSVVVFIYERTARVQSDVGTENPERELKLGATLTLILFTMKLMLRMPMKSVP